MFLAKFLAKLVAKYQEYCDAEGVNSQAGLDKELYIKALEKVLYAAALEDLNEHGRLLSLKEHLISLVGKAENISVKTLGLF